MALLRKLFYRKPPDGLLEICERVYVFDCCFTTDAWEEPNYKGYVGGIIGQLREHYPDASILVFNFREGATQSRMANALSEYDMTIMEYPRHYEGCPLLPMEVIHHFLRSSESWLSLGLQNVLLMHCERGGWPVLAFMLAALLIYRKHYSGEQKTLDMVYKQAPRELLHFLSPLNPIPSQIRYLQYISRRNVATEWPPLDRALTLDCVIIRMIPDFDGEGGCRPIFRVYGQDPFLVADRAPKILFSTPKKSKGVRHYRQVECELVKIDINCHIQGDVVLECISLHDDMEREEMMFRVMFNTAFIRSNILMLNRDEIDILWDAKDQFPKDFRAEVLFSEMDAVASIVPVDFSCFEDKDGLPVEAFSKVHEIFSSVDWLVPKVDVAVDVLQHLTASNVVLEKVETYSHIEKPQNKWSAALESSAISPRFFVLEKQSGSPNSSPNADESRKQAEPRYLITESGAKISPRTTPIPPIESNASPPSSVTPSYHLSTGVNLHCSLTKQSDNNAQERGMAKVVSPLPVTDALSPKTVSLTPTPPLPRKDASVDPGLPSSPLIPLPLTPPLKDKISMGGASPLPKMPNASTLPLKEDTASGPGLSMSLPSARVPLSPKRQNKSSTDCPPPYPYSPPPPSTPSPTKDKVKATTVTRPPSHPLPPTNTPSEADVVTTSVCPPPLPPIQMILMSTTDAVRSTRVGPPSPPAPPPASPIIEDVSVKTACPAPPPPNLHPPSSPSSEVSASKLAETPPLPPPSPQIPPPKENSASVGGPALRPPPPTIPLIEKNSATRAVSHPPPPPPMPPKESSSISGGPPPPPPPLPIEESSSIRRGPLPPPPPPLHYGPGAGPSSSSSMSPPLPPPALASFAPPSVPLAPPPPVASNKEAANLSNYTSTINSRGSNFSGSPSPPPPSIPPPGTKGKIQGSLWAETQKSGEASKPPEIDISELESLFSAAVPNPGQGGSGRKGASLGQKSEKVQLIDHRRAYNCEIMLSKVKITLHDLLNSVLALEDTALDVDQVDNLIKFCPTNEEMELLKGYKGEKDKLGKCEQFFLELMQVPRIESKLRVFSFKIQFRSQVSDLRNSLNVVNSAADQIRGSAKLKRIMQTILSLGNALNQGTARGSAVGFRLDSLLKLTDTRARNNKMTLMHYLCKVLADKLPELLDFWKDLSNLEPASKIQLRFLAEEMQAVSKGLEKIVQELSMSENDGSVSENFHKALKEFLCFAEGEVRSLASLYSGVGRNMDALILYFGEDPSRCPFEQVVSTLFNFVRMFKKAHEENCKQLELEKKKAEKEAATEKQKINASEKEIGHSIQSQEQEQEQMGDGISGQCGMPIYKVDSGNSQVCSH
ncbi:Formin-like protein [Abeliophyllum distichum]|uniref:Formin-like protein n=1 Tax=Abeliophyllum distichum TaxID=126358 RepID=A0ABD1QY81_9LAMI